jgi:tetratricopeptide (TPR) repeat protein
MTRVKILLVVLFVAAAMGAFAQAFSVSYVDGSVDVKTAQGWKALAIGDKVPADSSVRLSQNGSLELLRGKTRVTLLKDGIYEISTVVKGSEKTAMGGVGTAITQKLQSLTTEKPKGGNAVGGVRGADQSATSVTWADENDETRSQVRALLDKKRFADAIKVLEQAINDATADSEKNEFTFLKAVAYQGGGQDAQAYRALARLSPQPEDSWYARYIILKAQVLFDTQNFNDALALLGSFITAYPTGEATQDRKSVV